MHFAQQCEVYFYKSWEKYFDYFIKSIANRLQNCYNSTCNGEVHQNKKNKGKENLKWADMKSTQMIQK